MVALAVTVFVVGVLTGFTGVGGVLVIPALQAAAGLPVQTAMATAMCSFFVVGGLAVWLQQRRHAIDWAPARPLALAAAVSSLLGAVVNSRAPVELLNLSLSLLIIFAGASALFPFRRGTLVRYDGRLARHKAIMAGIGAGVGFFSGLTGAGGPVLSIPIMVALGFPPLLSIAAGQVLQVAVAGSGTLGNLLCGSIDFTVAAWISVLQSAGLVIGIRLSHRVAPHRLRQIVASVCLLVGLYGFMRHLALF
ncbi:sulfite exporter TauE/SafE family protein [Desulfovibrio sp. TomC]|uniref:sulfite exporter TauE/SafE family protein n=1 Tax=Desulfovibrio sp. TomC TaxID=1562888 RepID=UPI000574F477|nr:sulfite exporter TauE/SafE family protein [Desulfovibrio sp. TomC]KHK01723.1 membrane protein [Desulfovibrio sp. TomC]